jgi:hypothetical protein
MLLKADGVNGFDPTIRLKKNSKISNQKHYISAGFGIESP